MKKIITLLLSFCLIFSLAVFAEETVEEKIIHVSVNGNDQNSGEENAPLQTLTGARKKVSELRAKGNGFKGQITVLFHGGVYPMTRRTHFWQTQYEQHDSAFENGKTIYKSAGDGEVIFKGSKDIDINDFKEITDRGILSKIPVSARDKVLEVDLAPYGITKTHLTLTDNRRQTVEANGDRSTCPLGIYYNGKRQTMACWPNNDFSYMKDIKKSGTEYSFSYDDTLHPELWTNLENAYLGGYMNSVFTGFVTKINRVDVENKRIYPKSTNFSENNKYARYKVFNLLEELDCVGEYYVDSENLKLYYYPPRDFKSGSNRFSVAVLRDIYDNPTWNTFIQMNDVNYIEFDGLTFVECYGYAIVTNNSNYLTIKNCKFHDLAYGGVQISSHDVTIENCEFYNVGSQAISLTQYGMSYNTLPKSNNVVRNNHIYNVAQDLYVQSSSINVTGHETLVENNTVHQGAYSALTYRGTDNNIKHNEFFNLSNQTGDSGAIYTGRSWIDYGNIVEENYIHDMGYWGIVGDPGIAINGIFLDDTTSGDTVRNNIIENKSSKNETDRVSSYGVLSASGRDNTIEGNIFIGDNGARSKGVQLNSYMSTYNYDAVIDRGKKCGLFNEEGTLRTDIAGIMGKYSQIKVTAETIEKNKPIVITGKTGIYNPDYITVKNNVICNVKTDIGYENKSAYTRLGNKNDISASSTCTLDNLTENYLLKSGVTAPKGFILTEDYNINQIGMDRSYSLGDFSQTMPYNGETVAWSNRATLAWEQSDFADNYTYTVATDPSMENIVKQETTPYQNVEIEGLAPNTTYYWSVTANGNSFKNKTSKKCLDEVNAFTTSQYNVVMYDCKLNENNVSILYENRGEDLTANFAVASYEDNMLKDVEYISLTLPKAEKKAYFNFTLPDALVKSKETAVFLWDNNMKPYALKLKEND